MRLSENLDWSKTVANKPAFEIRVDGNTPILVYDYDFDPINRVIFVIHEDLSVEAYCIEKNIQVRENKEPKNVPF